MLPLTVNPNVRWAELLPDDFKSRIAACPVVYLPMGLCEPHGHIAAFGLDTIKADYLCDEGARRFGGIVAPTQGYHIHESGYHARWLEDVVGEENPLMTGLPPHVVLHQFLYQLRSFANAGFQGALVLSGHSGGNQNDLRQAASAFTNSFGMAVVVHSDPELVEGRHPGDHAGKYEISQLLYLRPDLVDMKLINRRYEKNSGGQLALGDDASDATTAYGEQVMEDSLARIGEIVAELKQIPFANRPRIDFASVEAVWREFLKDAPHWKTAQKWPAQTEVSDSSQWKPYEAFRLPL